MYSLMVTVEISREYSGLWVLGGMVFPSLVGPLDQGYQDSNGCQGIGSIPWVVLRGYHPILWVDIIVLR